MTGAPLRFIAIRTADNRTRAAIDNALTKRYNAALLRLQRHSRAL